MARTRWRRSLVVGVLLVLAMVITAVQYERLSPSPNSPGPDDPPAGVQLLYFVDASHTHTLVAYDWSGRRRGAIKLPTWVDRAQVRMSPDGSGFAVDPGFSGDYAAYFDRLGRMLFETNDETFESQIWAADGRHVCVLALTGAGEALVTRLPGYGDHTAVISPRANVSDAPLTLDACSTTSDIAIVEAEIRPGVGAPYRTRVARLRLSTGALLDARDFDGGVVASFDGAYVAVASIDGGSVNVYKASDMVTPIAALDPSIVPVAFSGDGTLVLATVQDASTLEAVTWKTGRTTWQYRLPGTGFGQVLPQPAGRAFAIALTDPSGAGPLSAVVADSDGRTTNFPDVIPVAW